MFSSEMSASFANHLFETGANGGSTSISTSAIQNPRPEAQTKWGCDSPTTTTVQLYNGSKVYPCFSGDTTLADEMQTAGISYKWYGAWIPGLMSTSQWDLWIGGIAVLSLIVGIVVVYIGQATIKTSVSDEEVIAQVTGKQTAG